MARNNNKWLWFRLPIVRPNSISYDELMTAKVLSLWSGNETYASKVWIISTTESNFFASWADAERHEVGAILASLSDIKLLDTKKAVDKFALLQTVFQPPKNNRWKFLVVTALAVKLLKLSKALCYDE